MPDRYHITRPFRALIAAQPLLPAILLAACSNSDVVPHRSAADDAQAIAAVQAAQKRLPPVDFVTLQPVAASSGEPCSYNVPASEKPPVFRFGPDAGQVMIDGAVKGFAADHGSIEVYPGVRQQYDGKEFSLQIQLDPDDPADRGNPAYWPAKVTIRDRYERTVYQGVGLVTCGAKAAAAAAAASLPAPGSDRSR